MKIILAPDSFKGSLTSEKFIQIASGVIKKVRPESEIVPFLMADGGEGSLEALSQEIPFKFISREVKGPLGRKTKAVFGMNGTSAYIEMASATGLLKMRRHHPQGFLASSFGTGELIKAALDLGAKTIYICLGGTGSVDGGCGAMAALGAIFHDINGRRVPCCAKNLERISNIDLSNFDSRVKDTNFFTLADVKNPLCGEQGAVKTFGKQKGLNENELNLAERGMEHFSSVLKRFFHTDPQTLISGGAAGGMGAALSLFCSSKVVSGAEMILKGGHFEKKCQNADYIFTGEGKIDYSSFQGKTIDRVAALGQKHRVKTVAFVGMIGNIEAKPQGLYQVISLKTPEITVDYSIKHVRSLLKKAIEGFLKENKN